MTGTLTITINRRDYELPQDFGSTPAALLAHTPYGDSPHEYELYRPTESPHGTVLTDDDTCTEPLAVSDGDVFTVVPKYINNG